MYFVLRPSARSVRLLGVGGIPYEAVSTPSSIRPLAHTSHPVLRCRTDYRELKPQLWSPVNIASRRRALSSRRCAHTNSPASTTRPGMISSHPGSNGRNRPTMPTRTSSEPAATSPTRTGRERCARSMTELCHIWGASRTPTATPSLVPGVNPAVRCPASVPRQPETRDS